MAVVGAWGCGDCARCRIGIETYCENPLASYAPGGGGGLGADGGMADYMLVQIVKAMTSARVIAADIREEARQLTL